ncbi:hypothetical protein NE237_000559 [Protea cynaroides]|uniref:Uncharacterized protein n=1 Tax=Protea cynaroides TaxID=273540 RepID=A0A9Q0KRE4_9MAGN|nr:hypothetical protein NE237_000559 [Protea cynaroides]
MKPKSHFLKALSPRPPLATKSAPTLALLLSVSVRVALVYSRCSTMAKSLRSKREKRLRTLRREIVEPFYEKMNDAKLAAQEAALHAPKLPVRPIKNDSTKMEITSTSNADMDVQMADGGDTNHPNPGSLKPVGGVGKKWNKKLKMRKGKRHGKGKIRRKANI